MENRNKPESLRGDILKQNSNVTQLILPHTPLFFCICSLKQSSYGRMACIKGNKGVRAEC